MIKVYLTCFVTFIFFLIFISCSLVATRPNVSGSDLEGEISISGAFALYPLAVKWADEFKKENPGVKIDISAGGAGKGMTDVLSNMVDIGMVSREVYASEIEKGAFPVGVAIDAVVPVINAKNPLARKLMHTGLSVETARRIWINESCKTWEQVIGSKGNTPLRVYTRSDACGAAETFAAWMGKKQEDLGGTAVFGDPGLAMAVQKDMLALGFNNLSYAYDEKTRKPNKGLLIIPLDVDGDGKVSHNEQFYKTKDKLIKAIAENKYPSPPARELYMVLKGKPNNPALIAFLTYILTRGQEHNIPMGYIRLSDDSLNQSLSKLGVKTNKTSTAVE